jgi:hypothetical protein
LQVQRVVHHSARFDTGISLALMMNNTIHQLRQCPVSPQHGDAKLLMHMGKSFLQCAVCGNERDVSSEDARILRAQASLKKP